jgi:type VI secretion system protein VasI
MQTRLSSLVAAAILVPVYALAQAVDNKELAKCAALKGDLERLQCFDDAAKKAGAAPPVATVVPTEGTGKWRTQRSKNPLDDSETVVISLDAESGSGKFGDKVTLVAVCRSNQTQMYVDWESYLGNDSGDFRREWKEIIVRVGNESARKERWNISTDKKATFAPDWAGDLLRKMAATDKFVVQLTPYSESPITAVFATAGLKQALVPLATVCKWKAEDKSNPAPPKTATSQKPAEPEQPRRSGGFDPNQVAEVLEKVRRLSAPQNASAGPPATDATATSTPSELSAIRKQILDCWSPPAGARNEKNLSVTLRFSLNSDGSLKGSPEIVEKARLSEDVFRATAESAVRAVRLCSPIKYLLPGRYEYWKDVELTFSPAEMLG